MIKLIATDMDGTLLTSKKEFPPDFDEILCRLKEKGIHFVAASGRSFSTLKLNFEGKLDKLDFICDNGAYVVVDGKLAGKSIIDSQKLNSLVKKCLELDSVTPVLCGMNGIYFQKTDDFFFNEVRKYYLHYVCVDDITAVDDEIVKVAVCDSKGPRNNSLPILTELFSKELYVAETGPYWVDVMNIGINKGAALEKIQNKLGISREETMAFGDYFNDAEMLLAAEYGFIMENAHSEMEKYGKYRAASNDEYGVTKAIREYVFEGALK